MATIVLTIPDTQLQRVVDAFAGRYSYQPTLPDGSPNPQTKAAFAKACLGDYARQVVAAYEADQAAQTARVQALQSQVSVT